MVDRSPSSTVCQKYTPSNEVGDETCGYVSIVGSDNCVRYREKLKKIQNTSKIPMFIYLKINFS